MLLTVGAVGCGGDSDSPMGPQGQTFGGLGKDRQGDGYGSSVQQMVDAGFIVTGNSEYDGFLLKTNELGNLRNLDEQGYAPS